MPTAESERKIITDRQARALLDLMRVFYKNPKNRAAYEAWKKAREATPGKPGGREEEQP